ncbi:hypothetical protein [Nostoc sp. FACHB-280]|nr:hypothetical protein [Nostoc sp. FACHB-280]MBD2495998.1 hypothetical protein [Nostoc sp. FACHB-280]
MTATNLCNIAVLARFCADKALCKQAGNYLKEITEAIKLVDIKLAINAIT